MATVPDKDYPLAIVDPEYGLNENLVRLKSRCRLASSTITQPFHWDKQPPADEYFQELMRCTQNQIIWGGNYFKQLVGTPFKAPRRPDFEKWISDNPTGWIVWDKVNGSNDFSDCELAWTSLDVPTQIFQFMWAGMMQGKSIAQGATMQGNKTLNEKRIHPTQKPVALYKWLLHNYAKPGDKILDTHGGSRSLAIACYDMGFDHDSCEIDEQHHEDSVKRYNNNISQQKLQFA